jgi:glycerophosphoryl diester phosphodiesterase
MAGAHARPFAPPVDPTAPEIETLPTPTILDTPGNHDLPGPTRHPRRRHPVHGVGSRVRRALVIAHRGASGYRPEHTLEAYELAASMGADYLEPDLVPTRDGVLVCRHEPDLSTTTDVAHRPEFAHRQRTKCVDGQLVTGWFVEDFLVEEVKALRVRERMPHLRPRNASFDDQLTIPTFAEVLDLRRRLEVDLGRTVGIYPEVKHPTYFTRGGLDPAAALLRALDDRGLNTPTAAVFVQCFEPSALIALRRDGLASRKTQLLGAEGAPYDLRTHGDRRTYQNLLTPAALDRIATYADAIGPHKTHVLPRSTEGTLPGATELVDQAHAVGLLVHAYTFRAEIEFLPAGTLHEPGTSVSVSGAMEEMTSHLLAGIDGLFCDQPDIAVEARRAARSVGQHVPVTT